MHSAGASRSSWTTTASSSPATRYQAARRLGLERVLVQVASGLSPEAARAYRLADNRTHEEAGWHPDMLNLELHELGAAGFELTLTGFDPLQVLATRAPRTRRQAQQPSLTVMRFDGAGMGVVNEDVYTESVHTPPLQNPKKLHQRFR
jgi:hypothetical protein